MRENTKKYFYICNETIIFLEKIFVKKIDDFAQKIQENSQN